MSIGAIAFSELVYAEASMLSRRDIMESRLSNKVKVSAVTLKMP